MTHERPQDLGFLIHDTMRQMRRRMDRAAAPHGLTRAQWQMLAVLARVGDGINQAAIAERLDLEPISVCRLVDRMEAGGWVERRLDPGDRRARLIFLTDQAAPALELLRGSKETILDDALAGFTEDEKETLVALLARCRDNLSRSEADEQATADHQPLPPRAAAR